jgi:hypothetical protein
LSAAVNLQIYISEKCFCRRDCAAAKRRLSTIGRRADDGRFCQGNFTAA